MFANSFILPAVVETTFVQLDWPLDSSSRAFERMLPTSERKALQELSMPLTLSPLPPSPLPLLPPPEPPEPPLPLPEPELLPESESLMLVLYSHLAVSSPFL